MLREHFEPKKVVIASCFQFHQWQQRPGETVAMFLAMLRKLAVPCDFGDALDEALRDRLVCGLREEAHQKYPYLGCSTSTALGHHVVVTYVQFRHTEDHENADGLSHLPLNSPPGVEASQDAACYNMGQMQALPVTASKLSVCSRHDPQVC